MLQPPVLYIKLHGKSSTLGTFKTKKRKKENWKVEAKRVKGEWRGKKKNGNHTIP